MTGMYIFHLNRTQLRKPRRARHFHIQSFRIQKFPISKFPNSKFPNSKYSSEFKNFQIQSFRVQNFPNSNISKFIIFRIQKFLKLYSQFYNPDKNQSLNLETLFVESCFFAYICCISLNKPETVAMIW